MKTDLKKQPQGSNYLIIGSGRLATHLAHYFTLLGQPFENWSRQNSIENLWLMLKPRPTVILAISDKAIEPFYQEYLSDKGLQVIHCSGTLVSENMVSCHPLMTFGTNLFDLETYQNIYFAVTGTDSLQNVLPFLRNPFFELKAENKALYHALCVLCAAGAQTIWSQSQETLSKIGVPDKAVDLYIRQIAENFIKFGSKALTGPWVRGDENTINQNLAALKTRSDQLFRAYEILKEGHHDNT